MPRSTRTSRGGACGNRGFTILELMVVLGIMALLVAVVAPAIFSIEASARMSAAVNTVSVAGTAARAYAVRKQPALDTIVPGSAYSGVAVIFTPSNEIRITMNDQLARGPKGPTENIDADSRNGYADIPGREYIKMPKGTAAAGIVAPGPVLVPTPFAIRFDEQGRLIASPAAEQFVPVTRESVVVYDGNYDGVYDYEAKRTGGLDVSVYDPESGAYDRGVAWHDLADKYIVPFEALEACIGVLVYSKTEFEDAGLTWANLGPATTWLLERDPDVPNKYLHSRVIFYSRHSGAPTKPE